MEFNIVFVTCAEEPTSHIGSHTHTQDICYPMMNSVAFIVTSGLIGGSRCGK